MTTTTKTTKKPTTTKRKTMNKFQKVIAAALEETEVLAFETSYPRVLLDGAITQGMTKYLVVSNKWEERGRGQLAFVNKPMNIIIYRIRRDTQFTFARVNLNK